MKNTEHLEELRNILSHFWPRLPEGVRERADRLDESCSNKQVSKSLMEIHDALDGKAGEGALAMIYQHAVMARRAA